MEAKGDFSYCCVDGEKFNGTKVRIIKSQDNHMKMWVAY
jgi:hypothetical protein